MKRISFRARLFVILLLFALVPSIVLSFAWAATSWWAFPLVGTPAAWDSAAATGSRALAVARTHVRTPQERAILAHHEQTLRESLLRSKNASWIFQRAAVLGAVLAVVSFGLLVLIGSRVAGHLSRNLSRPLQELVGWTDLIARSKPLPDGPPGRGAPEFEVLRHRMRDMSAQLELGRRAALEAERSSALREAARQVAHELKNPLTPIRFAVDRLRRQAPAELQETIEVLGTEAHRLENLAKSFAQFGRLPEGPLAPLDVGDLARYTARSSVPPEVPVDVRVAPDTPLIDANHEALARALSNVMLNAVEACRGAGSIAVDVRPTTYLDAPAVSLSVRDTGCGISPERLARIWDPYVTFKPGGTGLGLAIARQTVLAHGGDVTAESTPGAGTEIRFTLPLRGRASSGADLSPG